MLIDSHAHLNFSDYFNLDEVILRAKENGVEKIVNIGTSIEDSKLAIELAHKYENLFATVGIHPNDDPTTTVESINWLEFESLANQPKVVAIGECGLDYSRLQTTDNRLQQGEKARQKALLRKQIEIAQRLDLPVCLHVRDAYEDMLEIAKNIKINALFHCFSGATEYLNALLTSPGFYFSFAGNVTFRNAQNIRDLAKLVPLDKLLIETDCPFLAPEPFRGKRNEPANVKIVAEKIAEIKGLTFDEISKSTTDNTHRLLRL
jgi:TatD DNase family protein